ncbi:MAG: glycosyltransferase [Nanoarchaeota archaeon]
MKFSLVVPLAPDRDAPIIESIKNLDYPKSEFHVIVVKGLNPSANRNNGAEKAKGEIIAFLDDDALMQKNYLKEAEKFFNEHPEIDIVGGPQLSPSDENVFAKISGYTLSSKFGAWDVAHRYSVQEKKLDADESMLTSANLLCRKSVMDKIKFDTKLFPGEDPKFIEDAKKAGLRVAYSPNIIVYHKRRPTLKLFMKQMFNYGKTRPFKENFSQTAKMPFFLVPSAFIAYLISLIILAGMNFSITGNIANSNYGIIKNIPNFGLIYMTPLAAYLVLALIFSIRDSMKNKHGSALFVLPFIYLILHLAYGSGMIWGYIKKNFTDRSVG